MRHLFTYGPVPYDQADQVELKETEIGELPKHWKIERFDALFTSRLGKMLSQASRTGKSPHPYLRNANVQWGHVDMSDLYQMDFEEDERDEFLLREGDLLICEGGEVGRAAVWHGEMKECYFQKAIHRARPRNGRMSSLFIMYHFMNAFLVSGSYGIVGTDTTIAHLPGVNLKALPIPVPPQKEQEQIVNILSTIDAKTSREKSKLNAIATIFNTLLHHLMTGKVRAYSSDE
jgi:type I restriction enzyme, S subunit